MRRKRLIWQIYPTYLLITLVSLFAIAWYSSHSLQKFYYKQVATDLEAKAQIIKNQVSENISPIHALYLDSLCKEIGRISSTRITIILPSGKVIGDSHEDPSIMDNHYNRPEIKDAITSRNVGTSIRFSNTLKENMMYLAIPVEQDGKLTGVIRTAISITKIKQVLKGVYLNIFLGGVIISFIFALVSFIISRRISHPIEEMKRGTEHFACGDLDYNLPIPNSAELGSLAASMNQMAAQLREKIQTLVQQKNEQDALLSSMIESVIAVDLNEKIIKINRAAGELFGINPNNIQGCILQEVIRNVDLQKFTKRLLENHELMEDEIVIYNKNGGQFLQAHGTILKGFEGIEIGALIVLNNVTKIKRLENIRRNFVANVSHELRTPITAIKGFIETLRDGTINEKKNAKRFLDIISKQVDRLNAIIEDLLSLSRIEQEDEKSEIILEKGNIKDILEVAIQDCASKASENNLKIDLTCKQDIVANINAPLFEQAVVNLIDNAIKYSEPGTSIHIDAFQTNKEVIVSVTDYGCGIEEKHLPHLFERFYRVDKARSRKLGGTGLGLAIVKHIVLAHNGRVDVESKVGKGSKFTIALPISSS
ncbi:MAG: PAS domain-containing sensor histidine kinase [Candidatus Neomarinimicrobiota bacterium]|nr:MAG: PAS domain-containing sensor histidine kinase [Candidatus Neomarinimicrobiota bacterium]